MHTKSVCDSFFAILFIALGLVGFMQMNADPIVKVILETETIDDQVLQSNTQLKDLIESAD